MIKLPLLNSSTLPPSHLDFDVYTRTRLAEQTSTHRQ